jgi:multidrug efflux pump subunit AcrB
VPYSYGGKFRSVQIDLDPQAMQARGLSAIDVQNAFASQNQITPPAISRSAASVCRRTQQCRRHDRGINDMPVKTVNGGTVYLRDVGHVRDGNTSSRTSCMWTAPRRALHRAQERPGLHHRRGQRHQEYPAAAAPAMPPS